MAEYTVLFLFLVLLFDLGCQLGCKVGKRGAGVAQGILLVNLNGQGYHFGWDCGAVAIFVGALGFLDIFYGKGGKVALFLENNAAVGQDTAETFLRADDFDGLFGLEQSLQTAGEIPLFSGLALQQGGINKGQKKQRTRGYKQKKLPVYHGVFLSVLGWA